MSNTMMNEKTARFTIDFFNKKIIGTKAKRTYDGMDFPFMSGIFAELELSMIRARVKSGMANAKAKGVKLGRPQVGRDDIPAVFFRHYPAYKNGQLNLSEFARVCDLSRTTVYKYLSLLEA